ncbi:MAG: hypothetical protein PHU85_00615 [Phycisphaerae bacterium]|nr:hypothetical protein [Phycisphaerae bacterium]
MNASYVVNVACDCDPVGVSDEAVIANSELAAVWGWFEAQPDHVIMRGAHVCQHCRTRIVSCGNECRRIEDYSERTFDELRAAEIACAAWVTSRYVDA